MNRSDLSDLVGPTLKLGPAASSTEWWTAVLRYLLKEKDRKIVMLGIVSLSREEDERNKHGGGEMAEWLTGWLGKEKRRRGGEGEGRLTTKISQHQIFRVSWHFDASGSTVRGRKLVKIVSETVGGGAQIEKAEKFGIKSCIVQYSTYIFHNPT